MKSLLLVIDMQKAFINKNTEHLIKDVNSLVQSGKYQDVLFTRFINTKDSFVARELDWYGCCLEDRELVVDSLSYKVFDKNKYSAFNSELEKYIKDNEIDTIYICGIDTECCVLKTAFDLFEHEYHFYVLKDYCGSMCGEKEQQAALDIMRRNLGSNKVI